MSLSLIEITPARAEREAVDDLLDVVARAVGGAGAELVESQVTAGFGTVFVIVDGGPDAAGALREAFSGLAGVSGWTGPEPVRLVGADLDAVKAARPGAGYLVEWDLPDELDMETYLANKKAKAPLYRNVPETTFLRTYVREDMDKCLCFYDAPDEAAVRRARDAVSTPVDRVHQLAPQDARHGSGR